MLRGRVNFNGSPGPGGCGGSLRALYLLVCVFFISRTRQRIVFSIAILPDRLVPSQAGSWTIEFSSEKNGAGNDRRSVRKF